MESNSEFANNVGNSNPFKECVPSLAVGLLKIYEPLKKSNKELKELLEKQESLFGEAHQENLDFSEIHYNDDLQEMFNKLENFQNKLVNLRKDIKYIHEKGLKLNKRALKLQSFKGKDE